MMESLIFVACLYIVLGYGILYHLPDQAFRGRFLFQDEGSWKETFLLVIWPYDLFRAFWTQKRNKERKA